ncbi:MAG TPA: hypothetical protein VHL80_05395 [Polyangia bacterium]|nr:hypothetical protein [Polyangia bacterium]
MLPLLRIATSSPVPAHRALLTRVLASTRLDRGEPSDPDGFAPAWSDAAIPVAAARWAGDEYDLLALDDEVWRCIGRRGRCELRLVDDGADLDRLAESALQLALRFQRFDSSTNPASATPFFQQILAAHEAMFDRRLPLVAAEHDHALDTWRWVLRLEPHASLSLQLAALLHDAGASPMIRGPDDDLASRRAEAEASARAVVGMLESLSTPPPLVERTRVLIAAHEGTASSEPREPAAALLANADALSFFSLGAAGFARHFGLARTARAVAHGLRRLDVEGHSWLARLKLPRTIRALVLEALAEESAAPRPREAAFAAEPRP